MSDGYSMRDDNLLSVRKCIDKFALASAYAPLESIVKSDMARALANELVKTKFEKIEHEFHTEFRAEVYVFTRDEFMRAVQDEAMRLTRYFTPPKFSP